MELGKVALKYRKEDKMAGKRRCFLENQKFGKLTVKNFISNGEYMCECDCGKSRIATTGDLNRGKAKSCGCSVHDDKFEDLRGAKFNKLEVIDMPPIKKGLVIYWKCKCNCENNEIVEVRASHLKSGDTKSCGCLVSSKIGNKYEFFDNYIVGYTSNNTQFHIDKEDYQLIKEYTWYIAKTGYVSSTACKDVLLHRVIMKNYSNIDNIKIDHDNRNKLNNRKYNLRTCTSSQNSMNREIQKNNTSGFTGVCWSKKMNKWSSCIEAERKRYRLGFYENKEDAIIARLKAEKKYFKEFAPQRHLFEEYGI